MCTQRSTRVFHQYHHQTSKFRPVSPLMYKALSLASVNDVTLYISFHQLLHSSTAGHIIKNDKLTSFVGHSFLTNRSRELFHVPLVSTSNPTIDYQYQPIQSQLYLIAQEPITQKVPGSFSSMLCYSYSSHRRQQSLAKNPISNALLIRLFSTTPRRVANSLDRHSRLTLFL